MTSAGRGEAVEIGAHGLSRPFHAAIDFGSSLLGQPLTLLRSSKLRHYYLNEQFFVLKESLRTKVTNHWKVLLCFRKVRRKCSISRS